jgi:hypothetical protein
MIKSKGLMVGDSGPQAGQPGGRDPQRRIADLIRAGPINCASVMESMHEYKKQEFVREDVRAPEWRRQDRARGVSHHFRTATYFL